MKIDLNLLSEVTAFIWAEADMLDHSEHDTWLKLWNEKGVYIIPIDPNLTDYENNLNYAYDDHHMRQLRVERLKMGKRFQLHLKLILCVACHVFVFLRIAVMKLFYVAHKTCVNSVRRI